MTKVTDSSHGRYTLFEGGCRATAFIAGGFLPPALAGTTSQLLMHEVDWLPTFLALAGATPSRQIDGVNQLDALFHQPQERAATTNAATPPSPRTTVIYNIDPVANLSGIR